MGDILIHFFFCLFSAWPVYLFSSIIGPEYVLFIQKKNIPTPPPLKFNGCSLGITGTCLRKNMRKVPVESMCFCASYIFVDTHNTFGMTV